MNNDAMCIVGLRVTDKKERTLYMARTLNGGTAKHSKTRVPNLTPSLSVSAQVSALVEMGLTKQGVITAIQQSRPEYVCSIKDDKDRSLVAKSLSMKVFPEFSEEKYRSLYELCGNRQCVIKKSRGEKMDGSMDDNEVYRPGEVNYVPVRRISTGIPMFDWMFGYTKEYKEGGLPRGYVSLLCGAPGVGKSRALITMSQNIGQSLKDKKDTGKGGVLYFATEVDKTQFVNMMDGVISDDSHFAFTGAKSLDRIIATITKLEPDVVIVDSISEVHESSSGAGMKNMIVVLKGLAQSMGFHLMLIGQLNKKGEVAGSKKLEFLVDIVLAANPWHIPGQFSIACQTKNRSGRTGRLVHFKHDEEGGVSCIDNRRIDKDTGELVPEQAALSIIGQIDMVNGDEVDDEGLDSPVVNIDRSELASA